MSEEKMRAAFRKLFKYEMSDDAESETFARGYQAALQESEAGAVLYIAKNLHSKSYATSRSKAEAELFLLQNGLKIDGKEAAVIPLYPAPPSAQAIETAAIMKCAELMVKRGVLSPDGLNYEALLALIPQDGRTQLEEFGMKVAEEVKSATVYNECRNMLTKENELRSIVTNLIGEKK